MITREKGTITVASVVGVVTITASVLASYYTASATEADNIHLVETRTAVLEEFKTNTQKDISDIKHVQETMNANLVLLLIKQGISPTK